MHLLARLAAVVTCAAAVVSLAGCDSWAADPVFFARADGATIVRMCLPVTISSITLERMNGEDDDSATLVWSAAGSAAVPEGFEFAVGAAPSGLQVTIGPRSEQEVAAALGDQFAATIRAADSHGDHEFSALIDVSDFDHSEWVNSGGPAAAACVRDPCPPGYACLNPWPQPTGLAVLPTPTWTPTTAAAP